MKNKQVEKNRRCAAAMANATKGRGGIHKSKKVYDRRDNKKCMDA